MSRAEVEAHYSVASLEDSIRRALRADGKDPDRLTVADLAPVDEFHIRGRDATLELARLADLEAGCRVLDVGSGIGGSARHLASAHGCEVVGIDATADYCEAARILSRAVGLEDRTEFHHGSALDLPFEDAAFDVVWTEHVQMNIADKRGFYGEICRVLRPGGRLVFHDIFSGPGGEPRFPVPWAEHAGLSHLAAPDRAAGILASLCFARREWRDVTPEARAWAREAGARVGQPHGPRTGIQLLLGEAGAEKIRNLRRNLEEGRITVRQAVLDKCR